MSVFIPHVPPSPWRPPDLRVPLLLLLLLVVCGAAPGSTTNLTVKVFNLYHSFHMSNLYLAAIVAGFNASLASRDTTVPLRVHVETAPYLATNKTTKQFLVDHMTNENGNELPIVLGPVGDRNTLSVVSFLKEKNVAALAPFTGSSNVRGWNKNLYFTNAGPTMELVALVRYAVNSLRLRRLGFMYLKNVSFGDEEYTLAVSLMAGIGRQLSGVFTLNIVNGQVAVDDEFHAEWERFAATQPQGVIVFGSPLADTRRFLKQMVIDNRTRMAYVLLPSVLQFIVVSTWRAALALANTPFVPGRLILTGINPLAKDRTYHAIRRFQGEMASYLREEGAKHGSRFHDPEHFLKHDGHGELMVRGWIAGEVLKRALRSTEWLENRAAFLDSLYDQRRYVIDDIVLGDYGGECKGLAGERGASCECNQGGYAVYMKEIVKGFRLRPLRRGFLTLSASKCGRVPPKLHAPLNGVMFSPGDNPMALGVATALYTGASALIGAGRLGHSDRFFLHRLPSALSASELKRVLGLEVDERIVTAVLGLVDGELLSERSVAFIDPVTLAPRLRHVGVHVIYFSPTLEQQLFVLVKRAINASSSGVHAVIRGDHALDIKLLVKETLTAFRRSLQSAALIDEDTGVSNLLPHSGDVLVIGLIAADVDIIAAHLDANTDVRVIVTFTDFAVLYSTFVGAFTDRPSGSRLLFATNLPHWAEEEPTSETAKQFRAAFPNSSHWNPLTMSSFAAARALQALLPRMAHVTPWSLIQTVFGQFNVIADDMRYGPFTVDDCVFEDGEVNYSDPCVVNYGATRISVWSVERALNASVPPLTSPVTPSMKYHDADSTELSSTHLVAIIAGALTALLLLAAALATLLCFLSRGARDNNNAPKDLTEPVTLIFTDIESSTAQWAAHPELMPDAVAAHHRIIRSLIVRYECYEVKTVGDSFMIACRSPHAAVNLVTDLQQRFLHHDWGTTAFDDSYREFEQQRAEEVEGYVPPTGRLDPDVYRRLWNGLRVRSGVHTGLCDIRHDEVTKGYDYYGQTANMAARTESIANGGQVLLTRATYYSLSTTEREHTDVTMVGTVPLRGVQEPVEMYQLNVVTGRKHGALCLGREVAAECEEGPGTSVSDASSLHVELTEGAQNIAISLESLLGAFPHAQRQKLLMSFCERWRIALPQGSSGSWSRTFCNDVARLIAAKVGRVTDFGSRDVDRSRTSTMRNSSIFSSQVHGARAAGSILELSAPHRAGADEAARNVSHSPGGSELSSMASYSTIHIMPFKGLSGVL